MTVRGRRRTTTLGVWVVSCALALLAPAAASANASAKLPKGMPRDVPAAAHWRPSTLPEPSHAAWPFPSAFPQTSGTGRLDKGASLWSDFIYDDYGASSPEGITTSTYSQSSGLSLRQGDYVYPSGPADNNGADIFRAGVGLAHGMSYWRVDWVTLAKASVPIAEWTFDTDDNAKTGASTWPADAGVTSPGIEEALVVSSQGAWLINAVTGARTDVLTHGGRLTVDMHSKSFIVAIPTSLLPVSGTWRVRLAAGLASANGQDFAEPYIDSGDSVSQSPTAERVYNITFRTVAQEPPIVTDAKSDALVAAAQAGLAATPLGETLGLDGIARSITGNYWMEDDQADTLAGGNVSKFSLLVNWSQLTNRKVTPAPQPTGYSVRWYVSHLKGLGAGQVTDDGPEGNFKPTLLERVQPYAVYVPTTYKRGQRLPLTWILHSLEVNYNQYGALDPDLLQQLCQDRDSICATTEGFGPAGWYYNAAETDFWQVWRELAQSFSLNPNRTVISGYSMGGWASYKLAFEHPDDFAGALVLDGPVICGVEAYPGVNGYAYQGDQCSADGQSEPFIANAKWIPYVVDQTYSDELVPTTGVLAQISRFDSLGQRYSLFIHTGGDHLTFATMDRFGDAVAALGNPVRATDPGSFSYSWYPALNSSQYGLGATGDYWISGLAARSSTGGTIASVTAADAELPSRAITVHRSGTSLVTQPLPGTHSDLTWTRGRRPARRATMALTLTDVRSLTVNTRMAGLRAGRVTVKTDGTTTLVFTHLRSGTRLRLAHHRSVKVGRRGRIRVRVSSGTTVLRLSRPD